MQKKRHSLEQDNGAKLSLKKKCSGTKVKASNKKSCKHHKSIMMAIYEETSELLSHINKFCDIVFYFMESLLAFG